MHYLVVALYTKIDKTFIRHTLQDALDECESCIDYGGDAYIGQFYGVEIHKVL